MITGDVNCRKSSWYTGDPVIPHGASVEGLTPFYGLHQLFKNPVHLLQNSAACIDLVFTNQPQLVIESGIHSSLCSTCHHQIVSVKLNLKIEYLSLYERIFWDYSRAGKASINLAFNAIDCEEICANKTLESQLSEPIDLLLNIHSNYIPKKTIFR